jgi:hypothetical protein
MLEANNVMDHAAVKLLLAKSKEEPVHAAIGLGADGAGKILLSKTKAPLALGRQLETDSPALKNMRFGTAHVDVDENPKLVKIIINRPVSGLARKLARTLKPSGYTKVLLLLEDGSVVEGADDEVAEEHAAPPAPPGPPPAPPPASAPGDAAAAVPSAASLANLLKALIEPMRAVIAASPERRGPLTDLATAAQSALKAGDLAQAQAQIRALRTALEPGAVPAASAAPTAPGTSVAFQKMRLLWDGTRKSLHDQLKTLEAKVIEASDGAPNAEAIRANVTNLEVSLQTLDTKLSTALDDLYNVGGQDPKLRKKARRIAMGYQEFIATDPLMQELDGNPFIKLDARARLDATLQAVMGHL